ncbi:MAG: fibronectin type III domain-containing protein [Eubacterium sp.]
MKKRLLAMALICAVGAVILTGCMQENIETQISSTGTVKENIITYIDKSLADNNSADEVNGTVSINGKDISTLPVVTYKGVTCYKDTETNTYNTTDAYKTALISGDNVGASKVYCVDKQTVYFSISADDMKQNFALCGALGSELSVEITISYEFDKPIVQTNGVIDADNPNKVKYTINASSVPNEIFASTDSAVNKEKLKNEYQAAKATKAAKIKRVTGLKAKAGKKKVKLSWKKAKNAKKYQIQYGTKKSFSSKKSKATAKKSITIKKLKRGKTYYFRVRGIDGKQVGNWSKVKKVKIKK